MTKDGKTIEEEHNRLAALREAHKCLYNKKTALLSRLKKRQTSNEVVTTTDGGED